MTALTALVDAVVDIIKKYVDDNYGKPTVYAVWSAAETTDPDLSVLTIGGQTFRGVPKYAHVTGLVEGDVVECLHPKADKPLTIIGKPVGNISLT